MTTRGPIRQSPSPTSGTISRPCCSPNQLRGSAPSLIEFYARRMLLETSIADFFHIDVLSCAVALKINCDLQLILIASSLHRLLGSQIGKDYITAHSSHLFRDFVEAQVRVTIPDNSVKDTFGKRAHSPLLRAAGAQDTGAAVPWWPET